MLGVEVGNGLAERLKAIDPHFRGRKRVAPGHQARAVRRTVRFEADRGRFGGRFDDGLEHDADWNRRGGIESAGDLLRVGGDLLERFRSVQILAAGDEPNFKLLQIHGNILTNYIP